MRLLQVALLNINISRLLTMSLSNEELITVVSDRHYPLLRNMLLQNLASKLRERISYQKKPSEVAGLFLANHLINIKAVENAVGSAAGTDAIMQFSSSWTGMLDEYNEGRKAISHGENVIKLIAKEGTEENISGIDVSSIGKKIIKDASGAVFEVLRRWHYKGFKGYVDRQEVNGRLIRLYVLAHIAESEFLSKSFDPIYKAIQQSFENNRKFKTSTKKLVEIIIDGIWNSSPEVAKDPYMVLLMNIFDAEENQVVINN